MTPYGVWTLASTLAKRMSPARRQAITWTIDYWLSIWNPGNKIQWSFNQETNILIQEIVFQIIVCHERPY